MKYVSFQREGEHEVKIAYFISRVVVLLDRKYKTQDFYQQHNNKVTAFCVHPSHSLVASSSCQDRASIDLWKVENTQMVSHTKTGHVAAVNTMVFSFDGSFIASVAVDERHSLQVTDWARSEVVGYRHTGVTGILDVIFDSTNKYELCTAGYNSINRYYIQHGCIILKHIVYVNELDKDSLSYVTCMAYVPYLLDQSAAHDMIIATNFGSLGVVVGGEKHVQVRETAHKKCINSMVVCELKGRVVVVTGGEDELIKVWNMQFELKGEFNIRNSSLIKISSNSDVGTC